MGKQLSESEKRVKVVELAETLVKDAIIAVPPQTWRVDMADAQDTSKEATREELLFFRLGFIFMAYRVDFWYWEAIEMLRKLILTCFLIFIGEGWVQMAFGALITFGFLLLNLAYRPYCTDGLNSLQAFGLIAQFLTLFGGILIGYQRLDSTSEGSDNTDTLNTNRIGVVVVAINCMTMVWPLVRLVLVGKHAEYYDKVVWLAGCPHRCYMSYCGGEARAAAERDKAKQAREAQRRAAGVRRQASMARMDTTNSDGGSDLMDALRRAQAMAIEERIHPATESDQSAAFEEIKILACAPTDSSSATSRRATVQCPSTFPLPRLSPCWALLPSFLQRTATMKVGRMCQTAIRSCTRCGRGVKTILGINSSGS